MPDTRQQTTATMLFDLDGTLIDTAPDFIAVLAQMCAEEKRPPPRDHAIHQTVSSGARALVALGWGLDESDAAFNALHQRLLDTYEQQLDNTRSELYPGMADLLEWLETAQIPWGIVTNKPLLYSEKLLAALELSKRCAVLVCPDHVTRRKPDPEPLLLACRLLDCEAGEGIYVGDHPRDIESGRAAGMFTIAAAYGYLPATPAIENWQADRIVDSASDILAWIKLQTRIPT